MYKRSHNQMTNGKHNKESLKDRRDFYGHNNDDCLIRSIEMKKQH